MGAFKIAQQNYCDFFTNDTWDEEKASSKIYNYMKEERLECLQRFYNCLLTSKKMTDMGLLYLTHSNLSVRKTVELYNSKLPESKQINENTGKSRIIACANKINNSFEKIPFKDSTGIHQLEPLEILMRRKSFNDREKEVNEAIKQVDRFIDLFDTTKKNLKQQTVIKIPAYAKVSNLSEDRFNEFMDIIRPYSQREIRFVEEQIKQMKEEVGYYNFLLTPGVKLTEEDKERRDTLLRWLNTEESEENTTKEEVLEDFDFNDEVIF